jgi:hypothetical protein
MSENTLTDSQKHTLVLVMSVEVVIYGLMMMLCVWNIYAFVIRQKYYKNFYVVAFYTLALFICVARMINLTLLTMYQNDNYDTTTYPCMLPMMRAANLSMFAKIVMGFF